jgi:hypothetical protein
MTTAKLLAATADPEICEIVLGADIDDVPTFRLSPGQMLVASASDSSGLPCLRFAPGVDGLQLSTDNHL